VIKYLGSKRRLVPVLAAAAEICGVRQGLDLFTGTTRVAQAWRAGGAVVTAVDTAHYAELFARTYVETRLDRTRRKALDDALDHIRSLPPEPGYVTDVFCRAARYFRPENGARIDTARHAIACDYAGSWLEPVLLTALIEAADRVDSTTGVQMAYLKDWAHRAYRPLELRPPSVPDGPVGTAVREDAVVAARDLGPFDLAYLDPPYNQHRYTANYHVWETIARGDEPSHYGVACKRADLRLPEHRSVFNQRRAMPDALRECVKAVDARVVIVSYNNEAWVSLDELVDMCRDRGPVEVLAFDSRRYVGAQIGIHNPAGERVGTVSHLRNTEYLVVAGDLNARQRGQMAGLAAPND
jgi:adenine-specific DNA-methyltransferase